MSQRSRIQRLPGSIALNRHTRTHPRPSSLFQSMLRQRTGTRLFIGLIVLCLLCTQLVTSIASTIPIALANTTSTSSHFSSNSYLKTCKPKKRCPYSPAAFSVNIEMLIFTWSDPPPAPQSLTLTDEDLNPEHGPIPWHIVISTENGIHWLRVDKSHGKVGAEKPVDVNVSVKNKDLPPGTYKGNLKFIPGDSEKDSKSIPIEFTIPGPTSSYQ